MAKKKTNKTNKKREKIIMENVLPQNILPMGEHVEEDKNIYISQSAYKEIHNFTKNKLTNESGGMLIGNVIEALGKTNIIIQGFVEAKYCEATPTTLKFTHETWEYVHGEIADKFEDGKIVGWIHTHPDFGIFLSEYDKFIQQNFFKEEYQVAYVVDSIQHIEGFYFWINERIEKCKGFYIYDKTGEKIELDLEENDDKKAGTAPVGGNSILTYLLAAALVIAIIVFGIISSNLLKRMQILETRQENLVESANQGIGLLQQQNAALQSEIDSLQTLIDVYHPQITEEEIVDETVSGDNTEAITEDETDLTTEEEIVGDTTEEGESEEIEESEGSEEKTNE